MILLCEFKNIFTQHHHYRNISFFNVTRYYKLIFTDIKFNKKTSTYWERNSHYARENQIILN